MGIKFITENGATVDLEPKFFKPLTFTDLQNVLQAGCNGVEINVSGRVINSTIDDLSNEQLVDVKTNISFNESLSVYCLVQGGWLPPPFVRPANLLVDRNVVSSFRQISEGFKRSDFKIKNWWFEFFDNEVIINPLLYALEGGFQRTPTIEEFLRSYQDASSTISLTP